MRHVPARHPAVLTPALSFAHTLVLALLLTITGCTTAPTPQRTGGYAPPPDAGSSIAPRTVTYTGQAPIPFDAFQYKAHSRTTGAAMTLLIEPPVEVDDPTAVAQLKFVYDPGPVFTADLLHVTATYTDRGRYGTATVSLAHLLPPNDTNTAVVPLTDWQLRLLFPANNDTNRISINMAAFEAPHTRADGQRLRDAVATWQPVYTALSRPNLPDTDALAASLDPGDVNFKNIPLRVGDRLGAWDVARHDLTYNDTRYRPYALTQSTDRHPITGFRLHAGLEPAFLGARNAETGTNADTGRHDLQLRFLFVHEPAPGSPAPGNPANPPAQAPAPTRITFSAGGYQWDVRPDPAYPNHFAAHLPAAAVPILFSSEAGLNLGVDHGDQIRIYTLDTQHLTQLLNHLDESFYNVQTTDAP